MRAVLSVGCLVVGLAGCAAKTPIATPPAMPGPDACGASDLQHLLGQPRKTLEGENITAPMRILPPGSAMTMDYRPDRVNVELDAGGDILRIWCS